MLYESEKKTKPAATHQQYKTGLKKHEFTKHNSTSKCHSFNLSFSSSQTAFSLCPLPC